MAIVKIVLTVLLCHFLYPVHGDSGLVVSTQYGEVEGLLTENVRTFLGIPFAAPPTGDLRWKAPTAPTPWSSVFQAQTYGPACVQSLQQKYNITHVSEDCLYMNIYAPVNATNLPVMFWIYGGSFVTGTANLYDAFNLATSGRVIVVTSNYRLGALGYLSLESLLHEDPSTPGTGNYGMLDQRFALEFVYKNIEAFGGDPTKIRIFGESAGAISVCYHMVAPGSANLFSGAIMESGFCTVTSLDKALLIGNSTSASLGCNQNDPTEQLECLRAIDAETVISAGSKVASFWAPAVDGYNLYQQPYDALANGQFHAVPLMLGTNKNEASLFLCPKYNGISAEDYENLVTNIFGSIADQVLELYPSQNYSAPVQALIDLYSDVEFICPTRRVARAVFPDTFVYLYSFDHAPGFSNDCYGVAHSFELPFIFTSLLSVSHYTFTPEEQLLSNNMTNYWMNFAEFLDPNLPSSSFQWSLYNEILDINVVLDLELSSQTGYKNTNCNFWDQFVTL